MSAPEVVVTLPTPYTDGGEIDWEAFPAIIQFYQEAGVDGLFANCQSSEALKLSQPEHLRIVELLKSLDCKLPIYAGINQGDGIEAQAQSLVELRAAGADLSVIWLSTLPSADSMDEQVLQLAELSGAPLGIYECPDPEHRLFTDDELQRVAESGKITFFKDTCRSNEQFTRRMKLVAGSAIRSYQANWMCLPESIKDGAQGFSGWLAAARPDAVVAYCREEMDNDTKGQLHTLLYELQEQMRAAVYPASAKYLMQLAGVPIQPTQRENLDKALQTAKSGKFCELEAANQRVSDLLEKHTEKTEAGA